MYRTKQFQLLFLILLLLSAQMKAYSNYFWTFRLDNRFGEKISQPYLLGTFNEEGEYDPRCSSGLIPLRDDGKNGDMKAGDLLWTYVTDLKPSDHTFSVMVFRDNSTRDAAKAIALETFRHDDDNGVIAFSSMKPSRVNITVKVDPSLKDLSLMGSWTDQGAYIDEGWGPPLKLDKFDDLKTSDEGSAQNSAKSGIWTLSADISFPPREHRFLLVEGSENKPVYSLTGRFELDGNILIDSYQNIYEQLIVYFDDIDKSFQELFIVGSWDRFGEYDDYYSCGFKHMNNDGVDEDKIKGDRVWTASFNLMPDSKPYSVLIFDSEDSYDVSKALAVANIQIQKGKINVLRISYPPDNYGVPLQNENNLSVSNIIILSFSLTAGVIGFVLLIKKMLFPEKKLYRSIFLKLLKHRIMFVNDDVNGEAAANFCMNLMHDWSRNMSLRCGVISPTVDEKNTAMSFMGENSRVEFIKFNKGKIDFKNFSDVDMMDAVFIDARNISDTERLQMNNLMDIALRYRMQIIVFGWQHYKDDETGMPLEGFIRSSDPSDSTELSMEFTNMSYNRKVFVLRREDVALTFDLTGLSDS